MKDYRFFLSYARNDAKDDPHLKNFYEKLAGDVRAAAALDSSTKAEDIGFIDSDGLESGSQWTVELAEALQSSRVIVCLYSRSYFNSQWCGKEFEVFRQRIQNWVTAAPNRKWPPRIQPVLWDRPDKLVNPFPAIVDTLKLQYTQDDYGEMYKREGLYYLMRMNEEKEYNRFLLRFRERLVEAAKAEPPLPRLPVVKPWDQVQSAFHTASVAPGPPAAPASLPGDARLPSTSGPEVAWFVYVAGREQDYTGIRSKRSGYGQHGGAVWRPYLPPSDRGAGILTQEVLSRQPKPMLRETLTLSAQLVTHVKHALDTNTPVILIVDPWSFQLPAFQVPLAELNKQNFVNCGVIIIWNDKDEESLSVPGRNEISKTFADTIVQKQLFFRDSVTEVKLEEAVNDALKSVLDKIKQRLEILRPIDSMGAEGFPILNVNAASSER